MAWRPHLEVTHVRGRVAGLEARARVVVVTRTPLHGCGHQILLPDGAVQGRGRS